MLNRPYRNVAELGYAFRDLPWKTLDFLYHTNKYKPTGTDNLGFGLYRWRNQPFSDLVDQMGQLQSDDPRMKDLFHQAMEIWLAAQRSAGRLARLLLWPGLLLQRLTTREPTIEETRIALRAVAAVLAVDR